MSNAHLHACDACGEYFSDDLEFCPECGNDEYTILDEFDMDWESDEPERDGQPDEYTEWQDYMGGDDCDHGQYDHYDEY